MRIDTKSAQWAILAAVGVGVVALVLVKRSGQSSSAGGLVDSALQYGAGAAVDAAKEAPELFFGSPINQAAGDAGRDFSNWFGEQVQTAGTYVGIPRTSRSQCELDKRAGNWWGASFSCPAQDFAGDYLKYGIGGAAYPYNSTVMNESLYSGSW